MIKNSIGKIFTTAPSGEREDPKHVSRIRS